MNAAMLNMVLDGATGFLYNCLKPFQASPWLTQYKVNELLQVPLKHTCPQKMIVQAFEPRRAPSP